MGVKSRIKKIKNQMKNRADIMSQEIINVGTDIPGVKKYLMGECVILISHEKHENDVLKWHLSISTNYRYPLWDEIYKARYNLIPDNINMAMFLPEKERYLNVHEFCFHLFEVKKE